MSFVAAAIQMCSGKNSKRNLDLATALVRDAANAGAHYIQTPEMTTLLVQKRADLLAEVTAENAEMAQMRFAALARELNVTLHIGSMAVPGSDEASERVANRAHLFGPDGTLLAQYDKIHMFDVDLDHGESWRESAVYQPGSKAVVVTACPNNEAVGIGLSICYDLRFPELFRTLAKSGASIIGTPAAFTRQTGEAHWHVLQRARAIETGSFMISAAQCGLHEDGRETFGHAIIVNPWGKVIAETDRGQDGFALAEIDLEEVSAARSKIPALLHDRPIEVVYAGNEKGSKAVA